MTFWFGTPMEIILREIIANGGLPLKVGGCVRDKMLGLEPKDIDIEVYNLSVEKLIEILSRFGEVDSVGKSFGVLKLRHNNTDIDFSLPRLESKSGSGHKGFIVETHSNLSVYEAAARRDFTINSMGEDIDGNLIDTYGGRVDLDDGILRATSLAYSEDPLRVLRGMQFCSRFNLIAEQKTIELSMDMLPEYWLLPKERVFGEWYKWAEKCVKPSLGILFLRDCGWLNLYPAIANLEFTLQDPEWHPEKLLSSRHDVLSHTCYVLDAMAEICYRKNIKGEDKVILMFAALAHDFGKVTHTQFENGRIRSKCHDVAGVEPARLFLESIGCFPRIIEKVLPLVLEHMVHCYGQVNLKKLSNRLFPATISELLLVIESDYSGRPPLPKGIPKVCYNWEKMATELNIINSQPKPIIQGRHLIALGMKPSKDFKIILEDAYNAQLDSKFLSIEEALIWLNNKYK